MVSNQKGLLRFACVLCLINYNKEGVSFVLFEFERVKSRGGVVAWLSVEILFYLIMYNQLALTFSIMPF